MIGPVGGLSRWLESWLAPSLHDPKTSPWSGVLIPLEVHTLDDDLELLLLTCGPSALWALLLTVEKMS